MKNRTVRVDPNCKSSAVFLSPQRPKVQNLAAHRRDWAVLSKHQRGSLTVNSVVKSTAFIWQVGLMCNLCLAKLRLVFEWSLWSSAAVKLSIMRTTIFFCVRHWLWVSVTPDLLLFIKSTFLFLFFFFIFMQTQEMHSVRFRDYSKIKCQRTLRLENLPNLRTAHPVISWLRTTFQLHSNAKWIDGASVFFFHVFLVWSVTFSMDFARFLRTYRLTGMRTRTKWLDFEE